MMDDDKGRFLGALNALAAIHRVELSKGELDAWWLFSKDLPLKGFEEACYWFGAHGKFFPKPAEIRERIKGPAITQASLEEEAEVALGKAWEAIHSVGRYRSVVFDDPAIHLAIEALGGWGCFCDGPDNSARRRDFCRQYVAQRKRIAFDGIESTKPRTVLHGEHGTGAPKVIGNPATIKAWQDQANGVRRIGAA